MAILHPAPRNDRPRTGRGLADHDAAHRAGGLHPHVASERYRQARPERTNDLAIAIALATIAASAAVSSLEGCPTPALSSRSLATPTPARAGVEQP